MDKNEFDALVQKHKVFLLMKGTPEQPQCGFSAHVVHILKEFDVEFESLNVFETDKEQLKEFSGWPTFPQLWVNGKLVGGCDIVTELAHTGELRELLS